LALSVGTPSLFKRLAIACRERPSPRRWRRTFRGTFLICGGLGSETFHETLCHPMIDVCQQIAPLPGYNGINWNSKLN
jgi:hypothetical protein